MASNVKKVVEWRKRCKNHLLKGFGSKCGICQYDKCDAALEFHHLDPTKKEISWGSISSRSWKFVVEEISKCVCLCANCHREVHWGSLIVPLDIPRFNETLSGYVKYGTLRGNQNGKRKS